MAARIRKPNRRPDVVIDSRPRRTRTKTAPVSVPPPQPVIGTAAHRNPAFANMSDEQVWCRAFMHAWFLLRSETAPFTIGRAVQTRLYFVCAHGCGGLKRATHDSATGKRWAVSRSMPETNKVGRWPQADFEKECFARGLIEAFAEHGRAAATGKVDELAPGIAARDAAAAREVEQLSAVSPQFSG